MECVSLQFCGRIPWIILPLLTRNHSFLLNPICSSIERHLANGGNDRPSEILLRYGTEIGLLFLFCFETFRNSPLSLFASHRGKLSLLARYGLKESNRVRDTIDLEQLRNRDDVLRCDGGVVELTPVFRLSDCVDMFRECHDQILKADIGEGTVKASFLSSTIDCFRLREARQTSVRRSKMDNDTVRPPLARSDPGKVNGGRSVGVVSYKSDAQKGLKRGPRGDILTKICPDLAAKDSLKGSCYGEVIQRTMKNRTNKKKQTRDAPLKKNGLKALHLESSHYLLEG